MYQYRPHLSKSANVPNRGRDVERILLDPEVPELREFVREAILNGTVRVIPAGPGRIAILPLGNPSGAYGGQVAADGDRLHGRPALRPD